MLKRQLFMVALVGLLFIVGTMASVASASPTGTTSLKLVTEVYTVAQGDSLDTITTQYMEKATESSPREFKEFREGIYELNFDSVFKGREKYAVEVGDKLTINYWVTSDDAVTPPTRFETEGKTP